MTEEITLEMPWTTAVPLYVEIIANGTPKARSDAKKDLIKLARMGEAYRKLLPAAKALADQLNLWGEDTLERMNLTEVLNDFTAAVNVLLPSPESTEA